MAERMKTGIKGLDKILDGGFLYHNAILFKGPPGSGKTTLGLQMIYNGVMQYGDAGIVVLFEQFPQQLFRDLTSYHWDMEPLIKDKKITILFAKSEELVERNLVSESPLISRIHDIACETNAKRIVIDSISHFLNILKPRMEEREVLLRFINALKSIGLTPIMTAEMGNREREIGFEEYLVDCVIDLTSEASRDKTFPMRMLQVTKTRGHSHIRGKHPYRIGKNGVEVYPHVLPGRCDQEPFEEFKIEKIATGIKGLDELLGGGYPRGTSTILAGMSGTFKTTFGVQFLIAGAHAGEPGFFLTFNENPAFLASTMKEEGLDLPACMDKGDILVQRFFPKDFYMDEMLDYLDEEFKKRHIQRVVVDGINEMERSIEDPATYKDYISAFLTMLRRQKISSLFIQKLDQFPGNAPLTGIRYASMFDGIIFLSSIEIESAVHKFISILKMRGTNFSSDLREFKCGAKGLYVLDKFFGLSGILAGSPQGQYKRTVEEIFQPLYFVRDFISILCSPDVKDEQRHQIIDNLKSEVGKLVDKLKDHFNVEK